MKICLITTFPPSRGGLSEYGFHIAQELQRNTFVDLTILADELPQPEPEIEGFSVVRCWAPDRPAGILRLLSQLRECQPDVVWFNLLFSTFGNKPLNAFSGLMLPLVTRATGKYTHVTLHHLMDTVDLQDLGVRFPGAYRLAGAFATRMLLLANSVSVLMPRYRKILYERYGGDNVHVRAHGILAHSPKFPDFARRGNPVHRILAFGKWGTYKRLELIIDSFQQIAEKIPNAQLVIAAGDHPQAQGYVESVREKHVGNPRIEFTGYVEEDQVEDLFQKSSVLVMPYSSSTGCSGVAHLACAYGVPIVCANLEDFRQMAEEEDLAIEFYRAGDAADLGACLTRFLQNPEAIREMALQNFSAALRMTMPTVIRKYLRHFELQRHMDARRQLMRLRNLPAWLPSRSLFLRAVTRQSAHWIDRSVIYLPPSRPGVLGNGDGDHGRKLHISGASGNSNGIHVAASTGNQPESKNDQAKNPDPVAKGPASSVTDENQPAQTKWKERKCIDEARASSRAGTRRGEVRKREG